MRAEFPAGVLLRRIRQQIRRARARTIVGRKFGPLFRPSFPQQYPSGSLASDRAIIGNLGRRGGDVTAAEGSATPAERCGAAIALTAEPLSERTSSPGCPCPCPCPCPGRAGRG